MEVRAKATLKYQIVRNYIHGGRNQKLFHFLTTCDHWNFFLIIGHNGVMPRAQKPAAKPKHDPLHVQLHEDTVHAKYGDVSQPGKRKKSKRDKSDRVSEDEVRSMEFLRDCNLSLCRPR